MKAQIMFFGITKDKDYYVVLQKNQKQEEIHL
jgi:hypothetical protein